MKVGSIDSSDLKPVHIQRFYEKLIEIFQEKDCAGTYIFLKDIYSKNNEKANVGTSFLLDETAHDLIESYERDILQSTVWFQENIIEFLNYLLSNLTPDELLSDFVDANMWWYEENRYGALECPCSEGVDFFFQELDGKTFEEFIKEAMEEA